MASVTTTTHTAESIAAHALGVRHEAPDMRGLFDDWHAYDMACLRAEIAFLRDNAMEGEAERRALRFSRNHWKLACALAVGLAIIATVCR